MDEKTHVYFKELDTIPLATSEGQSTMTRRALHHVGLHFFWQLLCFNEVEFKRIERMGLGNTSAIYNAIRAMGHRPEELRDVRDELGCDPGVVSGRWIQSELFPARIDKSFFSDPTAKTAYLNQIIYNYLCRKGLIKIEINDAITTDTQFLEESIDPRLKGALTPAFRAALFHDPLLRKEIGAAFGNAIARNLGLNLK